jgi:hypothetical protein
MHTNVNLAAPVGVALLLGACTLVLTLASLFSCAILARKILFARTSLLALAGIILGYALMLFLFSAFSTKQVLARGEEKHFCEVDCHLAYSIADVTKTKTIGVAPEQLTAKGTFFVVRVQTRFDETTISSSRGEGDLYPNPRKLVMVTADGQEYLPSVPAQEAFTRNGVVSTTISTPLRPAESYTTTFVFDLPSNTNHPTLLMKQDEWFTRLIIGHENSFGHKATYFQI